MKWWIVGLVLLVVPVVCGPALVVSAEKRGDPIADRSWTIPGDKAVESKVVRLYDAETSVVCYVMPVKFCAGDCAYSPAISCVHVARSDL